MKTRPLIGILDDDHAVRVALSRFFNAHKLRSHPYASAQELFDSIVTDRGPDCLVVDVQMPEMNGVDVLSSVLRHKPNIPVIMITGREDERVRAQALGLGAYDFMYKPVDPNRLLRTIKDALFAPTSIQWVSFPSDAAAPFKQPFATPPRPSHAWPTSAAAD